MTHPLSELPVLYEPVLLKSLSPAQAFLKSFKHEFDILTYILHRQLKLN